MRQITVRGTGTTAVRPDTVELGFTLHTERAVYAETAAAAAEASDKLRAAVVPGRPVGQGAENGRFLA